MGFASERWQSATLHPNEAGSALLGLPRAPTAPLGITTVAIDPQFTAHASYVGLRPFGATCIDH